jgi:hypothetical protein
MSSVQPLVDAGGRRRSPAAMPGFRAGKVPRNKGQRYPADPPTVDELVAVMREAQQSARSPTQRPDRPTLARRAADPRGAGANRDRSGSSPRVDSRPARKERSST